MHSIQGDGPFDPTDTARYCLRYLAPRSEYDEWIKVGMACQSVADDLLNDWLAWSSKAPNFNERQARAQWRSFKSGKGITLGTLIHMAKGDGMPFPPPSAKLRKPTNVEPFVPPESFRGKSLERIYPFSETYVRVRFADEAGGKDVVPYSYNGREWVNREPSREDGELLPLYRASDVGEQDSTVYVVEGEKSADAVRFQLQLVAVSSGGGSSMGNWSKYDWRPLKGRRIIILPDNDAAGAKFASEVAVYLRPIAASVLIAPPFNLGPKADVVDWLEHESNEAADHGQLLARLAAHVAQGKQQTQPGDFEELFDQSMSRLKETHARGWLGLKLPSFQELDIALCGLRGLMLLGAAPGLGKTQLSMQLGIDAVKADPTVGMIYLSLEMSPVEIAIRLTALATQLPYRKLVLGDQNIKMNDDGLKLDTADTDRVKKATNEMKSYGKRLTIYSMADIGTLKVIANDPSRWYEQLLNLIQNAKERMGVTRALIVIDNLQSIMVEPAHGTGWSNDLERDRLVIEGLSRLQKELGDAVLAISEVIKSQFKDSDGMSDLLGTGRNAYRADVVMVMTRKSTLIQIRPEAKKTEREYDQHKLSLQIEKGRDGVIRRAIDLKWNSNWSCISEVAPKQ